MTSWYCPLPFRHAYIDSTGIASCCRTPRYQGSLQDWPQNPNLVTLQKQFLAGQKPAQCHSCAKEEDTQGRSLRTDSLKDYDHLIFTDTKIDFIDFRSVNICNFKCRSCFPVFSHGIAQELNRYPELQKFFAPQPKTKTVSVTDENIQWIQNNLHEIQRLMLTGGEPTMIPGVQELVKQISTEHSHMQIMITSNASFKDDFWFDITEKLPNLHWTVSIDAVGAAAEIVRHGTDWPLIEKNVLWLARNAHSLDINSVVSNISVFGLRPLLQFANRVQELSKGPSGRHGDRGCRHQFFICQRPYYLAADNWPDDFKTRLITYLDSCRALPLDQEQEQMVSGLLGQLHNSVFDPELWKRTQSYNRCLDDIRNENHLVLYEPQI